MADFEAVPAALRLNTKFLMQAADAWEAAQKALNGKQLAEDDMGFFGKNFIAPHNRALQMCLDKLKRGQESLDQAASALSAVANEYESRDQEYYRKFGYLD